MSNFSVTNSVYLRDLYSTTDRSFSTKSKRSETDNNTLINADTKALLRGIKILGAEDYGDKDKKDSEITKSKFFRKMQSFKDAFNYTLDSASKSDNDAAKKAIKKFNKIKKEYADELEDLGVTFNSKGYMELSDSAFDNIDEAYFEDTFGKNSDFMKDLKSAAASLNNHIDVSA